MDKASINEALLNEAILKIEELKSERDSLRQQVKDLTQSLHEAQARLIELGEEI